MSLKKTKNKSKIFVATILGICSLTMILPFFWMVTTSFDWAAVTHLSFPPTFWPKEPSIKTYIVTFTNIKIFKYMLNTVLVIAGIILFSGSSALLAGYGLSKIRFRGSKFVLMLSLSVLMIPFEVIMIPQYLLFNSLKLLNTYFAFWLPGICYVFGTFFVKQYMDSTPDALREAAMIDGASEFRIFFRIYLPLCGPVTATIAILLFLYGWNDLLWPLLVLSDVNRFTIQIGIAMFKYYQYQQMPAILMAAATISILPVLIVYLFVQRYIVESIAVTGIKQ